MRQAVRAKAVNKVVVTYCSRTPEEEDAKMPYEPYRRRRKYVAKESRESIYLCRAKVFLLVVDEDERRSHIFSSEQLSASWPLSGLKLVSAK